MTTLSSAAKTKAAGAIRAQASATTTPVPSAAGFSRIPTAGASGGMKRSAPPTTDPKRAAVSVIGFVPSQQQQQQQQRHQQEVPVAGAAKEAVVEEEDHSLIQLEDIAVVSRGGDKEGEASDIRVIRRAKNRDGTYVELDKDRGNLATIRLPVGKLVFSSDMAGEGNVGKGKDPIICRAKAKYTVGWRAADLTDECQFPGLAAEQKAAAKKIHEISRHILGQIFDIEPKKYAGPIKRAKTEARLALMGQYKLTKVIFMENEEKKNPELAEIVRQHAREVFINNARPLPGAPRDEAALMDELAENGSIEPPEADTTQQQTPIIWLRKSVWSWIKYNPKTDAKNMDQGPSLEEYPSSLQYWDKIHKAMTALRRKYTMLQYVDGKTGNQIKRPLVPMPREDGDGKPRLIEDPFFNPCMINKYGVPQETLVVVSGTFNAYAGPAEVENMYGVRLDLNPIVAIVKRKARTLRTIVVRGDYVQGYVEDEPQEVPDQKFEQAIAQEAANPDPVVADPPELGEVDPNNNNEDLVQAPPGEPGDEGGMTLEDEDE